MSSRKGPFVALGLLVATLGAGCGSSGGPATHGIPVDTAAGLAARADRVAAALDAGACDQAQSEALSLQSDINALKLSSTARTEAADRAARLVAAIHCPPPATVAPTTVPTTVVMVGPGPVKGKKHKGADHDD